jgi:hypothetical protein
VLYEKLGIEAPVNESTSKKTAVGFFKTRNIIKGFYTHLISPDRGILSFTPIMLVGLIGFIVFYRFNPAFASLFFAIIVGNILLYSMWGDPYGGWAFGSRYLIPTYALGAILTTFFLTKFKKNILLLSLFALLLTYSVCVNSLGAITTSANPPQVEVAGLAKQTGREEKYTYQRNVDFLKNDHSKSFIYQVLVKNYISSTQYYLLITLSILAFCTLALMRFSHQTDRRN